MEYKPGNIVDDKDLQHQRHASDHSYKYFCRGLQRLEFAHGAHCDRQSERQTDNERYKKNQDGYLESIQQKQRNLPKRHVFTSLK